MVLREEGVACPPTVVCVVRAVVSVQEWLCDGNVKRLWDGLTMDGYLLCCG